MTLLCVDDLFPVPHWRPSHVHPCYACAMQVLRYFMGHSVDGYTFRFYADQDFIYLMHHSDNAVHFKSGKMLYCWSKTKQNPPAPAALPPPDSAPAAAPAPAVGPVAPAPPSGLNMKQKLSLFFIEFGCAGHGKGPWDGLGAVLKSRIRRDILHNNIKTQSNQITSAREVAEHLRAVFCSDEWRVESMPIKPSRRWLFSIQMPQRFLSVLLWSVHHLIRWTAKRPHFLIFALTKVYLSNAL